MAHSMDYLYSLTNQTSIQINSLIRLRNKLMVEFPDGVSTFPMWNKRQGGGQ